MISKLVLVFTFLVSLLSFNSSASNAFPGQKFETWFSTYAHHFEKSSTTSCHSTLQQYKHPNVDSDSHSLLIAYHADCILANTTETIKANMASAGVILSLMPSLISFLGPTPAESSILMLERPFLSSLLAIGSPAFYSYRPFDHQSPVEVLKQPSRSLSRILSTCRVCVLISLLQYLLALAAVINVVTVSLQLGLKTVVTWRKAQSYLPLIWVISPLAIHFCATARLYLFPKKVWHLRKVMFLRVLTAHSKRKVQSQTAELTNGPLGSLSLKLDFVTRVRQISSRPAMKHFWHISLALCYRF